MPTYTIPITTMKFTHCLGLGKMPLKEYCLEESSEQLGQGNALLMSTPNYGSFAF